MENQTEPTNSPETKTIQSSKPSKLGNFIDDVTQRLAAKAREASTEYQAASQAYMRAVEIREQQHRFDLVIDRACLPERHKCRCETTNEHKQWGEAYNKLQQVIEQNGLVVITGERGSGKTQAAVNAIWDGCKAGYSGRYTLLRELSMELRSAFKPNSNDTEKQTIETFIGPHLLVVDECQEGMETDFERRSLTMIVDKRYMVMKPTILMGNIAREKISECFGSSISSRISECGGVIEFSGWNFRTISEL